jgi:hypothetical protein
MNIEMRTEIFSGNRLRKKMKQMVLADMLNFRMKRKSYKMFRTTQVRFLPSLVPNGPVVCEKYIKM